MNQESLSGGAGWEEVIGFLLVAIFLILLAMGGGEARSSSIFPFRIVQTLSEERFFILLCESFDDESRTAYNCIRDDSADNRYYYTEYTLSDFDSWGRR